VHGPHWMKRNVDIDYVWPYETYAVVDGQRHNYTFEGIRKSKAHILPIISNPFVLSDKKQATTPVDQAFEKLDIKNEKKISKEAALDFAVAAAVPEDKLTTMDVKSHLTKTDFEQFVKSLDISTEGIQKALKGKTAPVTPEKGALHD